MTTRIEWVARPGTTPESWNPITGCTKVSQGCRNCYAERMARRLAGRFGYPEVPHHFDVTLHPDKLDDPLHWRKPRTVFVCSMSDLFHEDVPDEFIWRVIEKCYEAEQHTFQILTKRPQRALDILTRSAWWNNDTPQNIWLGVTAENQKQADLRIPILLQIPAAVRFVSCEPLLGSVDLWPCLDPQHFEPIYYDRSNPTLDWVIVGGESGPGARPMHPQWARDIRDQCQAAGVPFFMKQCGAWRPTEPGDVVGHVFGKPFIAMSRVGKKRAGHLLDGREYHQWPA